MKVSDYPKFEFDSDMSEREMTVSNRSSIPSTPVQKETSVSHSSDAADHEFQSL